MRLLCAFFCIIVIFVVFDACFATNREAMDILSEYIEFSHCVLHCGDDQFSEIGECGGILAVCAKNWGSAAKK